MYQRTVDSNELVSINNNITKLNSALNNYNQNILPKSQAYIQTTFYDKPENASYFTTEKKSELIARSNNASEIIQIESFQNMPPSKWDI